MGRCGVAVEQFVARSPRLARKSVVELRAAAGVGHQCRGLGRGCHCHRNIGSYRPGVPKLGGPKRRRAARSESMFAAARSSARRIADSSFRDELGRQFQWLRRGDEFECRVVLDMAGASGRANSPLPIVVRRCHSIQFGRASARKLRGATAKVVFKTQFSTTSARASGPVRGIDIDVVFFLFFGGCAAW